MSVDDNTKALYDKEAPDILNLLEKRIGESGYKMIKNNTDNDNTSSCIALDSDKFCKIQKKYGPAFLPDICYSYPRNYKQFAGEVYMTANIGCPESARQALFAEDGYRWDNVNPERLQSYIRDFMNSDFRGQNVDTIMNISDSFLRAVDDQSCSADEILAKIIIATNLLDKINISQWAGEVESALEKANKQLVSDELSEAILESDIENDVKNLLAGLVELTSDRTKRVKYAEVTDVMNTKAGKNYTEIRSNWNKARESLDGILKNYLKAKLSEVLFPVGCYFANIKDEAIVIATQYVYVRLALMCYVDEVGNKPSDDTIVTLVQTLERTNYALKKQKLLDNYKITMGLNDVKKVGALVMNY